MTSHKKKHEEKKDPEAKPAAPAPEAATPASAPAPAAVPAPAAPVKAPPPEPVLNRKNGTLMAGRRRPTAEGGHPWSLTRYRDGATRLAGLRLASLCRRGTLL